ncbi:TetR/AcrR family transcriptional regulator [Sphingomonas solaris]|uniref:TetR/AcrR family transcriptional regulator n=2 Tax=Alterirhizorhabdus solaris TaxID=2529389 RepID=A0A558R5F6_9SPHN|nr:TetR/AcrR family transcriptional regulator [Sphingomonas solaris]
MAEQDQALAPRRRRRSSQQLTDLILEAAAAEFEDNGFAGATTAAIARRAAVTETQLFRFYPSKQALFRAAIFEPLSRHFAEFNARHPASGGEPVSRQAFAAQYIDELQLFIERNSRMMMSLIAASAFGARAGSDVPTIDGMTDYFAHGAAMMAKRVGDDPAIDPALMVRVSFAAVLGNIAFRNFLFPGPMADDQRIREAVARLVLYGVATDGPPPGDGEG